MSESHLVGLQICLKKLFQCIVTFMIIVFCHCELLMFYFQFEQSCQYNKQFRCNKISTSPESYYPSNATRCHQ